MGTGKLKWLCGPITLPCYRLYGCTRHLPSSRSCLRVLISLSEHSSTNVLCKITTNRTNKTASSRYKCFCADFKQSMSQNTKIVTENEAPSWQLAAPGSSRPDWHGRCSSQPAGSVTPRSRKKLRRNTRRGEGRRNEVCPAASMRGSSGDPNTGLSPGL